MSHLTDFQIQEVVFGDCFFLWGWFRKLHLRRCPICREKASEFLAVREEQSSIGEALKEFRSFSVQADATMKMPKS